MDWRFGHVRIREAVLDAGSGLEKEPELPTIPEFRPVGSMDAPATMAFDGGYARRVRKGRPRNFAILTGVIQKHKKIKVFAMTYPNRVARPDRLRQFAASAGVLNDTPVNVTTDEAGSLLRLKTMLPIKTRFVLDYFHVAMDLRRIDQSVRRLAPCRLSPGGSIFEP